jgi:hypothetical protein
MIGFASRRDGHMSILEPNAVGASIRRLSDATAVPGAERQPATSELFPPGIPRV